MEFQACILLLCITLLLHIKMLVVATTTSAATGNFGGERDRVALLAFKSNINHDPQGVMSSWNDSHHFCDWQGVTCGHRHRRVTILELESRGLVGSLSPFLGNLSFLREMRLSNNTLQGEIPPQIGRLFRLNVVLLTNNSLEGEIPVNLFRCVNLEYLNLGNNKFVGKIPQELGSLTKLKALGISLNNLTGGIPPSIGNLTSLEILSLAATKLGGSIPDAIGRLKNLRKIMLGESELFGTLPASIYNLSFLTLISLPENQLHGSLPPNLGHFFPRLQIFQIWNNYFTGSVPFSLSNASELQFIEMGGNNFSGKIFVDFRSLQKLSYLTLDMNNLGTGGADDMKFLTSLLNCSSLEVVGLSQNNFGGKLPNSVGNISTQLRFLHMADNRISGSVPLWIGNLVSLTFIFMRNNQFTGSLPDNIGKLQNLQELYLNTNGLSGELPSSLGNLSSLAELYLDDNRFRGTIPSSLGNCQNLLILILGQNSLSGTIPKQLFNILSLSVSLDLHQNHFVGILPLEVGNLTNLEELDVSKNQLSGEIPRSLSGCSSLQYLFMGGNYFRGSIPLWLSSSVGITKIDLSSNKLSGKIPEYLEKLSLNYLNLSFNDLEGEVPTKGVFAEATTISVLGNKRLCGGIPELNLSSCPIKETKNHKMSSVAIILISLACVLLGVMLVSSCLYIWSKKNKKEQSSGSLRTLLKVSYAMLLQATDNFSMANLIGVGSFGTVYKGVLDPGEQIVAIKVLNLQRRGASRSFMAECEALRNIRHRNLVKIITSCSSVDFQGNDFKALVYEFMPNGNLDMWLHPIPETTSTSQDQFQNVNLLERVNIVIDVAYALDYLHHHCDPPIVHCDLKPSNILLDSDMTAHVGDFGLAKFLQEFADPNWSSSIGIRGTIGYAAPEYGLGSEVSTNGDVYSFGIVVLQMMTGKRPTDSTFEEGENLHNLARMALPDRVMEIVDPKLVNDEREAAANGDRVEESLMSMVSIGVACSMESPQDRMDITNVVHELCLVRDILQRTADGH